MLPAQPHRPLLPPWPVQCPQIVVLCSSRKGQTIRRRPAGRPGPEKQNPSTPATHAATGDTTTFRPEATVPATSEASSLLPRPSPPSRSLLRSSPAHLHRNARRYVHRRPGQPRPDPPCQPLLRCERPSAPPRSLHAEPTPPQSCRRQLGPRRLGPRGSVIASRRRPLPTRRRPSGWWVEKALEPWWIHARGPRHPCRLQTCSSSSCSDSSLAPLSFPPLHSFPCTEIPSSCLFPSSFCSRIFVFVRVRVIACKYTHADFRKKKKRRGQGIPRLLGKILRSPASNPPPATTTRLDSPLRLVLLPRSGLVLEFGAPSCSSLNSTSLARFGSIRFGSFQSGFAPSAACHRCAPSCSSWACAPDTLSAARSDSVPNTSQPPSAAAAAAPLPADPGAISTRAAGSLDDSDRSGTNKRRKASSSPHPGPGGGGGGSMAGEKAPRAFSIEELPGHLIGEVLTSGGLAAADLARLEATCRALRPLAEYAASKLCAARAAFAAMGPAARGELLERCGGSWKKVLRFLQSVEQSSGTVETSSGSMQVATGRYHTLLVHDSSVYSCGSSLCGVLGHGPDTTQCAAFSRVSFPSLSRVINISASHNHAAFVTESGEVFTCGDNSSLCCGHGEVGRTIFRPMQVEALKGIPCKQVATGLSFTVILTRDGQVYTCGSNTHGQLGHGDTIDRATPKLIELFEGPTQVVQIAAGASYTFAVTDDGTVHSFGSCTNFCLGHGDQHDELLPRAVQSFKRRNIHVVRVSAGDEHAVALDALGYVYTWGRGYCGALGHGDENDKTSPELISSLKGQVAVQVCARKRKTFVLTNEGSVVAFGWMGFGSLGFSDRGSSDKVMRPRVLESLQDHYVSQISTGLYHTVAVTNKGIVFGFGDNERAQLGQEYIRGCLKPTEIMFQKSMEDIPIAAPSG